MSNMKWYESPLFYSKFSYHPKFDVNITQTPKKKGWIKEVDKVLEIGNILRYMHPHHHKGWDYNFLINFNKEEH